MKNLFLSLLFIHFLQISQAQEVGEIRRKAREHQQKSSSSSGSQNNSESSSNSSSGSSGNLGIELLKGIFNLFLNSNSCNNNRISPEQRYWQQTMRDSIRAQRLAQRLAHQDFMRTQRLIRQDSMHIHREKLRSEGKLNPKYGLDLAFDYGGIPNYYQSYRPKIRGRVGVFSSELRYSALTEKRLHETNYFNTIDWQILQINPVNLPQATWRLGFGIMNESETSTTFPEFTTGLDLYFQQQRIRFAPEFRYAFDFSYPEAPRLEWNADLSYALINQTKAKMYLGFTTMYARYYQAVDLWSLGLGLKLRF